MNNDEMKVVREQKKIKEEAFNDACRLMKQHGSSAFRDWFFALTLADWLLGDIEALGLVKNEVGEQERVKEAIAEWAVKEWGVKWQDKAIEWRRLYVSTHDNLLRYGQHDTDCNVDDDSGTPCNCGLSEALVTGVFVKEV